VAHQIYAPLLTPTQEISYPVTSQFICTAVLETAGYGCLLISYTHPPPSLAVLKKSSSSPATGCNVYFTWLYYLILYLYKLSSAYITSAALRMIMFHLFSGKPTGETRPLVYKLMHYEKENGVGAKVLEPIKNASWNERERDASWNKIYQCYGVPTPGI